MWRAMAAIAQAAADAARSALPRLRRATAVLAEELDASRAPPDHAPSRPAGSHPEPAGPEPARAPVTPLAERISAIVAGVVGAIRRQSWCLSWPLSWWRSWWRAWRVSWWRSSWRSWLLSWRQSWCCGARHCHTFSVNPGDKLPFSAVLEGLVCFWVLNRYSSSIIFQARWSHPALPSAGALGLASANVGTQPSSGP